jgi:hypothetical protein
MPDVKLLFKSIKLSANCITSVLIKVCVPLTVKLPVTTTSPEIVPPDDEYFVLAAPYAALA